MQLDTANIIAILITAGVTIGNLIFNFFTYKGQNRTEDRRIGIDEKRLDQESSRTQTDATVQITSAATSLTGVYSALTEQLRTENAQLREELQRAKKDKDELEILKARISDIGNLSRETLAGRVCPFDNEVCMTQSETILKMISRVEEQHVHVSE